MPTAMKVPSSRPRLAELPAREVRSDIQGLRAIAVLLVVGFHLYPNLVVGGFVGVDVFFVVSGFLITSHLLRSPPRRWSDFAGFWGRRIRRLLPASLLVIVVTVVAGCLLLPASQLTTLGRDALSSALYVENWNLAGTSVDYLASTEAPSPLQHYWSLGVEEQFYLIWPFLIAAAIWVAGRLRSRIAPLAAVLGAYVLASFVVSIVWTATQPAAAYFVTPTRLWELGAGGLVAVVARSRFGEKRDGAFGEGPRAAAGWLGLATIAVAAVLITSSAPFPGWIALLPVGGAALFTAADSDGTRFGPGRILRWRPIQFVGDISYSIYLWHFPLIVLLGAALGGAPLTIIPKAVLLVACLMLAWLTKRFVEDPIRTRRWFRVPVRRTYIAAAIVTAAVVLVTLAPPVQVSAIAARAAAEQQKTIAANGDCYGAADLVTTGCSPHGTGIVPAPATAREDDTSSAYADGCFEEKPFSTVQTCRYGDPKASHRIALVGNSHAVQWLPALQALAAKERFSITTFVASGCPPTTAHVIFDTQQSSDGCRDWGRRVVDRTAGKYDLVVFTSASNSGVVGVADSAKFAPQTAGYADVLQRYADAGQQVLVIRDTPIPFVDIPDCLTSHPGDVAACDGPRSKWETPDPIVAAANRVDSPRVRMVDLNDHFCGKTECYAVIGGVLGYFDYMHAGATFITTTAPYLAPAIRQGLAAAG